MCEKEQDKTSRLEEALQAGALTALNSGLSEERAIGGLLAFSLAMLRLAKVAEQQVASSTIPKKGDIS